MYGQREAPCRGPGLQTRQEGGRAPDSLSAPGHRSRGSSVSPRAPRQRASGSRPKLRPPPSPTLPRAQFLERRGAPAGFPRCAWEADGFRTQTQGRDPEEPPLSNAHTPEPPLRFHSREARAGARWSASDTPAPAPPLPGPHPGPNSIAPGLMNSRALIGSPGVLWIYVCRLSFRGRRAPGPG